MDGRRLRRAAARFTHWYARQLLPAETALNKATPGYLRGRVEATAWQSFHFIHLILALVALLAIVMVVVGVRGRAPARRPGLARLTTAAGALATALILAKIIDPPGSSAAVRGPAWLALLAAAGIAIGGYVAVTETDRATRRQP